MTFLLDPVNDSGLPFMTSCPAPKSLGNVPVGDPWATSTATLPNKPSRTTVIDDTTFPKDKENQTTKIV